MKEKEHARWPIISRAHAPWVEPMPSLVSLCMIVKDGEEDNIRVDVHMPDSRHRVGESDVQLN